MIKKLIIFFSIFIFYPNISFGQFKYFEEGKNLFDKNMLDEAKFKFEQDIVFNPKN